MSKSEIDKFEPEIIYQLGWLTGEDKDCYKVSGQLCMHNGDVGDTIIILKSTVITFKKLKIQIPPQSKRKDTKHDE